MDGSILMVVELEGIYLIAFEIFANYALTDLYFYNRVKILIIFFYKNIDRPIIVAWYSFDGDESFKRGWKDE